MAAAATAAAVKAAGVSLTMGPLWLLWWRLLDLLPPLDDEGEVEDDEEEDLLLFLFLVLLAVGGLGESGGDALTSLAVSAPPALCIPAWPAVVATTGTGTGPGGATAAVAVPAAAVIPAIGAEGCRCGGRAARDRTAPHADGGYCGGCCGCS